MSLVEQALWLIESRLGKEISLASLAAETGVSRFHLSRAFGMATGRSMMNYVRARRLTIAAYALSTDADEILPVALNAGYGSHEAFTRAFREQFGLTPETVRHQRHTENIELVQAFVWKASAVRELDAPRFRHGSPLLIAGISERYTFGTNQGIPCQWERFRPYIGNTPGQIGNATYGICCNSDGADSFEYVAGVEVSDFADQPHELSRVRVPSHDYAVFSHSGHVATLRDIQYTIWNKWLPKSGHRIAASPDFERYGEDFDPVTGKGLVEIWMPIETL